MSALAERKPLPMPSRSGSRSLTVQPNLKIGRPGDKYEQEAESVANHVVMSPSNVAPALAMTPAPSSEGTFQMQAEEEEETLQMMPFSESTSFLQLSSMEEEETVQLSPDLSQSIQLQEEEKDTIQLIPDFSKTIQRQEEEETIQLSPDGSPTASPQISSQITQSKGAGQSLPKPVQAEMGQKIGADFSGVNIHTGSQATGMSNALGAQAFTHGSDIYFNEGKYQPETSGGKHLLAHELTHTVQQGSAEVQPMIQREEGDNPVELPSVAGTEVVGIVNTNSDSITYNSISIPGFKGSDHRGEKYSGWNLKRSKNYSSSTRPNNQQEVWKDNVKTNSIEEILRQKATAAQFQPQNEMYVFEAPARPITSGARHVARGQKNYYIGSLKQIAKASSAPAWNKRGSLSSSMEVDHIVELQISGQPQEGSNSANTISNMELLERRPNQQSGDFIKQSINEKVDFTLHNQETRALLNQEIPRLVDERNVNRKRELIKSNFDLVFSTFNPTGGPRINDNSYWTKEDIERGDHLNQVTPGDFSQLGEQGKILIFPTLSGGIGKTFTWDGANNTPNRSKNEHDWLKPFEIIYKRFNSGEAQGEEASYGEFQIQIPEDRRDVYKELSDTISIDPIPGAPFAGRLSKQKVQRSAEKIELKKLSPITVEYIDISTQFGIEMGGKVLPTIPFISNAQLEYRLRGNELSVFKVFDLGDFNIPAPFEISNSSLTLEFSTERGLAIEGLVNFGIQNVGEGHIGAAASTSGGFELEGAFNFDSELFDPAEIRVEYKNEIWTIGGTIGIPEGKIRGVKNATITATYSENNFVAEGEAELDIPGIERGTMQISYGEEGFSIGGNFDLSSEVPGISGGNVQARVSKAPGDTEYNVFVSGTAQPDIPGIDSTLSVTYDNGALTIEGSAQYRRGMLSGSINVAATNRAIGEDGQPTGDPTDTILVYGGGSLTLQITPWLAATAEVQFLPNGELEVTARLSSDEYEVFRRREINRNLFRVPTIEIPLFAIPLGPRSIGLVAQIGGGLDFTAGFGPGTLQNMSAEITYNPARESETTLNGHGEFAIPADAGLTLSGDLSLGVSVGVASLTGGIELEGSLGLEGEALASVDVNWSPMTGLTIDAMGRITVNPKFSFGINAFARASLGIGLFSISETWRHNLASFEWGPDIQFGIVFPVHYQEGEPFAMSFDDIELIYPDLDVVDMAVGLARDIKDDIF